MRKQIACAALTSDDLPMPRAPHSSALLAGSPRANRMVLSISWSAACEMPLSSLSGTRLTLATAWNPSGSACQTKASAASKSTGAGAGGASRSSAAAIRSRRVSKASSCVMAFNLPGVAGFRASWAARPHFAGSWPPHRRERRSIARRGPHIPPCCKWCPALYSPPEFGVWSAPRLHSAGHVAM